MEIYYYSPSETFVVLTADQFVGRDDGSTLQGTLQGIKAKIHMDPTATPIFHKARPVL